MCGHSVAGYMDGIGRGEQAAIGLCFQIGIGALNIPLRHGVAGRAVHTNCLRGCRHASVLHARRPAEHQHLVGSGVLSALPPSLLCAANVGHATRLRDR